MTWSIPQPTDIAGTGAGVVEGQIEDVDARSSVSVFALLLRVMALEAFPLYLFQSRLAKELFPDTATIEGWLPDHGAEWGVPQTQAAAAIGNVIFEGTGPLALPADILMAVNGVQVVTTAAAEIASGGSSVSVAATAVVAGTSGNLAAGTVLTLSSPIAGLTAQTATIDSNGFAGGTDQETETQWQQAIVNKIRNTPMGGSKADYSTWVLSQFPGAYVNVVKGWSGAGTVGVIFALAGPTAATPAQVASLQAYLNGVAPITATVTVVAATLVPVPVTLALTPDTTNTRAAVVAALEQFFVQTATVGGTAFLSQIDAAISSASGVTSFELAAPTADTVMTAYQLAVYQAPTFT